MNLSLGAIFTVAAVFSYVILGQDFAEELRAIRPTHRCCQQFDHRVFELPSGDAVEMTTISIQRSCKEVRLRPEMAPVQATQDVVS